MLLLLNLFRYYLASSYLSQGYSRVIGSQSMRILLCIWQLHKPILLWNLTITQYVLCSWHMLRCLHGALLLEDLLSRIRRTQHFDLRY